MLSQSEIKYNTMMEKAEELFIQFGYKAVSMDQIADASGISKMTIYKHFSTKEDLFLNILYSMVDKVYKDMEEQIEKAEGTLEKIDVLFKLNTDYSKQYSLALYKDILDNQRILEIMMLEKKRMMEAMLSNILRNGMERGDIRKIDVSFVANILNALLQGLTKDLYSICSSRDELESFTKKFYDFLKYGLLGGKGVK